MTLSRLEILMAGIELYSGDITQLFVDAIVNAANEQLIGGGGVDGAIHAAAGPELVNASRKLAPCPAGHARLTPGFNLQAKFVIHAVGPIFKDGTRGESKALSDTYRSALEIADHLKFTSVAFPCISTGAFSFPQDGACEIAIQTCVDWLKQHQHPKTIVFCCFEPSDLLLYTKRLNELGIFRQYKE